MTPTAIPLTTPTATPLTYGLDASMARFSVARYQKMVETGILTSADKVELLENYVVFKMPRNPPHDKALHRILEQLFALRLSGWTVRVQAAIELSDSQPEPDLALARGTTDDYGEHHPRARDIGLAIEVADSSLVRDQRDKMRIYARGGIVCYWIVNLVDRRIEVYSQPSGPTTVPAYGTFHLYQPSDAVPLVLDGTVIGTLPAAELLP